MTIEKNVKNSRVTLNLLTLPEHANVLKNIHGGVIMKVVDEAGAICAMRHAQRPVVTVAIDSMIFHSPVRVGELLTLQAHINYTGRSSMEVEVKVTAENPITGQHTHTNSAYLVYVALDDTGRPTPVPTLVLETPAEEQRWTDAEARQAHRLSHQPPKDAA